MSKGFEEGKLEALPVPGRLSHLSKQVSLGVRGPQNRGSWEDARVVESTLCAPQPASWIIPSSANPERPEENVMSHTDFGPKLPPAAVSKLPHDIEEPQRILPAACLLLRAEGGVAGDRVER